jgi:hypothetical protein
MNTWKFLLLQNFLANWLGAEEIEYEPSQEELEALQCFIDLSDQSQADRLWLVKEATALGMRVEELIQLRRLGEIRQLN